MIPRARENSEVVMKFTQIYTAYILRIYYQNILGIFISSRNPRIPDWKSMDKFTDLSTIH